MHIVNVMAVVEDEHLLPTYATEHSSGMDLKAAVETPITLQPMERKLIPTGVRIALPIGYEAQVRPRSGLALKHGVTVLNTPGTVDADYRGEIGVILINLGSEPFEVKPGERIAQLVIAKYEKANLCLTDELNDTERGERGFGHSGL